MVYIREAHPSDGWQVRANEREKIVFEQPEKLYERKKVAETCQSNLKLTLPFVLDGMDNKVENAYAGWPDRLYIVGVDGKIAYKGAPGPRGFNVAEMTKALDALLTKAPQKQSAPEKADQKKE